MAGPQLTRALLTLHRAHGPWLLALALLAACQAPDGTTSLRATDAPLVGKGTTTSTAPTVTSAAPAAAPQDTTIDVTVTGSGFATGARATWSLAGDTTQVHVKSTRVVSATQLVATIVVPAGAPVAQYDVQVMLTDGKKGVGADLFTVTLGDPAATFSLPLDDANLGLRSDGLYVDGGSSVYSDGVCGVRGRIFATASASNSGDATVQGDNPRFSNRKCAAYPRRLIVVYADGVVGSTSGMMNLNQIQNTSYRIAVGDSALRNLNLADGRCSGLRWRPDVNGVATNGDQVWVKRTSNSTWEVTSQAAPDDEAYCIAEGRTYHVRVKFTITSSRPLP